MRALLFTVLLTLALASLYAKPKSGGGGAAGKAGSAKATPAAGAGTATPAPAATPSPDQIRVVIAGDSTVANNIEGTNVFGWGEYFMPWRNPAYWVVNLAKKGESSTSYQMNGLWKAVMDEKPNVVFIQFGHNDALRNTPGSTEPETTYKEALLHYLDSCKKMHARPILVTPPHPLGFGEDGKLNEFLADYTDVMRRVAKENNVTLLDLYAASANVWNQLGPDRCIQLQSKPTDFIHYNKLGARTLAEIVRRELRIADPEFALKLLGPVGTGTSGKAAEDAPAERKR
jgi:lysophospholipase L1-like esterase